jgi:hypothetical protein
MSEAINLKFVSYVATVGKHDEGPPGPVDIVIVGHSVMFTVEREQSCFPDWLDILKKSAKDNSTVVFTFNSGGSRITSLESGDRITGVVESIPRGAHAGAGFKLLHYADMFFLPRNHSQASDWLILLHKSCREQVKIVFAYDAFNRRVRSLALARQ